MKSQLPRPVQATVRALLLALWTFSVFTLLKARSLFSSGGAESLESANRYSNLWCKGICKILGIRLKVTGAKPVAGAFIAPNHLGYADIFAIGALAPCSFLTTTEIASWPIVGSLVKATGQIPMVRFDKGRDLVLTTRRIRDRLSQGNSVCVFLEGTSTGGEEVLPFFSPVLQSAIDAKSKVVPTAIHWSVDDPGAKVSESVAYWKDHVFARHFWGFLRLREVTCEIAFGEPVSAEGWHRKPLASWVHARVEGLLAQIKTKAATFPERFAQPSAHRTKCIVGVSST